MEWSDEALLIVGGILAGIVNTISGSGTLFTMGVMSLVDIPLVVANIATRPGVFFQNLAGLIVLRRYRQYDRTDIKILPILFTGIGAMAGAVCAGWISGPAFNLVATVVLIFLLIQYIFPFRLKVKSGERSRQHFTALLFGLAGFYAGFIQIGIGILLLSILLNQLSMPYAQANAYKLIIILVYTVPTTLYFTYTDAILWKPALLVAAGQIIGATLAAAFISVNTKAVIWAKWITIMMILATLVKIWVL